MFALFRPFLCHWDIFMSSTTNPSTTTATTLLPSCIVAQRNETFLKNCQKHFREYTLCHEQKAEWQYCMLNVNGKEFFRNTLSTRKKSKTSGAGLEREDAVFDEKSCKRRKSSIGIHHLCRSVAKYEWEQTSMRSMACVVVFCSLTKRVGERETAKVNASCIRNVF